MRGLLLLVALAGCDELFGLDRVHAVDASIDVPRACTATTVTANAGHTCVVMTDGRVLCWGDNTHNQSGPSGGNIDCEVNGVAYRCTPTPVAVSMPPADKLGMADQSTCGISGTDVYCWGKNNPGHLGGAVGNVAVPTLIMQRAGSVELDGGQDHMCSRTSGGDVLCAGLNSFGEVGDTSVSSAPMPVAVRSGATAIGTGYNHSCAVVGGTVYCWGRNDRAQVTGATSSTAEPTPTLVAGITSVVEVDGGVDHTCVRHADRTVSCWGGNASGQLGQGDTAPRTMPAPVAVTNVESVRVGAYHACAMTSTDVYCWGEDISATPMRVDLPGVPKVIAAGGYHSCAVLDDGSVYCWGWNAWGQLGDGQLSGSFGPPRRALLCP